VPRGRTVSNNLPLPLSSFVGRDEAMAEVRRLLATTRLLTLTGPGGVGKTRLALEVATASLGDFDDGVCWVDLAPLCEAGLVAHTAALALGLSDDPQRSYMELLEHYLRERSVLLVLDNCEHVVAECAELAGQLLAQGRNLVILATSREPLGIDGETVWAVPPLTLPCLEGMPAREEVFRSEAGQLFLERARASRPDLVVTEAVAGAIAEVCCRLEGIPLAIELAAARVRVLSVPQIAARLDDLFQLLAGGSRIAFPRHQTIEATIAWSYDLLTRPEQKLFERLATFVGFGLEAAGAVASDPAGTGAIQPGDVLELLSQLVQKSLVLMREGERVRYSMLETIRQYAWERLLASGELPRVRQRHLRYHVQLAERAESKLEGEDQLAWLRLLEVEHDNLRHALVACEEMGAGEAGLRLAAALAAFWLRVGYLSEGAGWLERALAAGPQDGPVRAKALYRAGRLAQQGGDYAKAMALARKSLTLSRDLGDKPGMARGLSLLGWITHARGDRDRACRLLEEGLALARESGEERTIARTLLFLGDLRLRQGAYVQAAELLQECLGFYQQMGDGWNMAWALGGLGELARRQGDHQRAVAQLQLSLVLYEELDSKPEIPYVLEGLALVAADQGQFQRAARLWGAASSLRHDVQASLWPSYEADYAPAEERARASLGAKAFALARAEGQEMTRAQALALAAEVAAPAAPATSLPDTAPVPHSRSRAREYGLTPRQAEVLRLVAAGLTDAQVAEKLVISPRTVGKHLQSIYSKLDLPSRSAATRWAIKHDLD
jgi:predicted ATPase/DNA-binding CsgD family transcriptional regulator